ncbi:MAG: N-acetylmuramoyl-L-alanine amidase [Chloroflexaceae bacterium]|nr:N-acetylmuramoyl-L-alanine amidase [Chloroflexaceae bacterium]
MPRAVWSARREATRPTRTNPRGIILHQIDTGDTMTETLALLRAETAYQTEVLGWEDLAYHYLIDKNGMLYEGRLGGPTALVPRLAGGDAAIHIALIGPRDELPSEATQQTLVQLLAWLGQAFDIAPNGEHAIFATGSRQIRQNIIGHSAAAPEAPDPGEELQALIPELRDRTDNATTRSRWYFAQGDIANYAQQFAFLNLSDEDTTATVTLLPAGANETFDLDVAIPAGGRAQLDLNDVLSATTSLPAIIESNQPIIAERILSLPTDLDTVIGVSEPSRIWYFAEGSTAESFRTELVLFNPQATSTEAVLTYMLEDGSRAEQRVLVPAQQQLVVAVADVLPERRFGMAIVASQPIVAERTMRFGVQGTGIHSGSGMSSLSRTWFFAEGSTQNPFQMDLLLLNPNAQATVALVTFMTPDGTSLTRRYALPPTTRLRVDVNEIVPELGVAIIVQSDRPLAAERALYFTSTIPTTAENMETLTDTDALPQVIPALVGTISTGADEAAYTWYFPDGTTVDTNQYLLLSNPSRGQARVTVEFLLSDGSRPTETLLMPANSRFTLPVHELHADEPALAMIVRSTQPIVAERSLFPDAGPGAGGGSTMLGVPSE